MLGNRMGRIVIDKTGLSGNYDFTLVWDPDSTPGSTVPSVFAALQGTNRDCASTRKKPQYPFL